MSKNALPNVKKVAIVGAGGIGSHVAHLLYDYGVNRNQFDYISMEVDIYDDDVVDSKNLLHQNYVDNDLHKFKVEVMANKYILNPIKRFMTANDFDKYDVIFCCVDTMTFRKELYEWSWANKNNNVFWIDGRCESRQGCIFNSSLSQEKLEPMLSDSKDKRSCLLDYEKKNNIAHVIPVIVAGMMVQTFLNYIRGDKPLSEKIFMI